MGNENYSNYYVEILTGTMTDAIVRNVSLQAQTRVINEVVESQSKQLDEANSIIGRLKNELEIIKSNNANDRDAYIANLQSDIQQKNDHIGNLNNQINDLNHIRNEYENVKHQVAHLDTFRNELVKERELHQQTKNDHEKQIELLNKQIEKLKPTPVKKSKPVAKVEADTLIKDGGSF